MIRVAYLISTLSIGGIEKYVVELCNRLDRSEFAPMLISFREEGNVLTFLQKDDVPVFTLKKPMRNDWRIPARVAKVCQAQGVSVLHSNNWGTLIEAALARQLNSRTRWVHVQHGLEFLHRKEISWYKRWARDRAAHWAIGRADAVAAVSSATREFMQSAWGTREDRVQVIYNGVNIQLNRDDSRIRASKRDALGIPHDAPLVVSVGRWNPVKNYPYLIEAFAQLTHVMPNARLLLVGDGDDAPRIREAIQKHGLTDVVYCAGQRTDVGDWLLASDLFALSSVSEGISLSILEAMFAGLPVVATNVGGNPELIDETVGALVPVDNPTVFAQALRGFLEDDARRAQCSVVARKRVEEHFMLDSMVARYEALYRSLHHEL